MQFAVFKNKKMEIEEIRTQKFKILPSFWSNGHAEDFPSFENRVI